MTIAASRYRVSRLILLNILILNISCGSPSYWLYQYKWTPDAIKTLPTQSDYPDAAAVFLLDEAHLEVHKISEFSVTDIQRHTVVKILNERGYKYANVVVPYDENSNLYHIDARTILPDGTIIPLKKDHIFDTNLYPDFVFYSDVRAKRFTMPAVEEGCIVEYTWNKSINQFNFWTGWQFQKEEPVLVSKYNVRCPEGWDLKWKAYGIDIQPEIDNVMDGMKANHTWEVHNLPAYVPEISMPSGSWEIPHIMFSPLGVTEWDDIARWYDDLARDRMNPSETVRQHTRQIIQDLNTPEDKLKAIFSFVRDRIRYIAIEIGMGSYQPHEAEYVLHNRFGDCKDMATLLIAMGEAAGLTVHPVMISTWYNGAADTSVVSQAHFNHLITRAELPDGTIVWMDPTEKRCPFGELPWYDQDRLVVSLNGPRAMIEKTPIQPADQNLSERHWCIDVDTRGNASGTATMTFRGAQASELRRQMQAMHPVHISSWFGRELLSLFPLARYDEIEIENLSEYENPLIIHCRFSANRFMMQNGDLNSFIPGEFGDYDWHRLFSEPERKFAVQLKHPLLISDILEIQYPENWIAISGVVQDSIQNQFGQSTWDMQVLAPGKALFRHDFKLDATWITPEAYRDFRNFLSRIALSNQRLVLFKAVDDTIILPAMR